MCHSLPCLFVCLYLYCENVVKKERNYLSFSWSSDVSTCGFSVFVFLHWSLYFNRPISYDFILSVLILNELPEWVQHRVRQMLQCNWNEYKIICWTSTDLLEWLHYISKLQRNRVRIRSSEFNSSLLNAFADNTTERPSEMVTI